MRHRFARLALLAGIGIFALSMSARGVLQRALASVSRMLDEGLIVLGWIALWRPIEEIVYEWVPLYRKRRLYARLAAIRLSVHGSSDSSTVPHMHTASAPSAGTSPPDRSVREVAEVVKFLV